MNSGFTNAPFSSKLKPMSDSKVSLVIITLNEENNIERCIRSAPWVDDIVVVDSGSTDKTVELAESLGARVFVEEWRGYRLQKIRATELAKYDWVLSLDADEGLSPDLNKKLQEMKTTGQLTAGGYESPRLTYHLGRWIRHGGWYPDKQIRFFNRQKCKWSAGHVHERIEGENIQPIDQPIYHWPFPTLSEQVQTNDEYSSLAAKDLWDQGKKFSLAKLLFKPVSKFIETYLFKRGFLDGLPGLIISVGASYSMFLKFSKLWEMSRLEKVKKAKSQKQTVSV